ncbi:HAAS signaling domain-containing protein [Pseudactinotalea terrae]|uniref:HAAS signaling domain-containing protein n=1 Tax=Pseudactinotalea terrae TaxID=1743262 RepID=UPI0012E2D801|nr:hypothetical protein [Pseudactinotalea terrae]
MSTLSLTDRLRRWSYLQDVELWLDPMSRRRRREVLHELRTNLADAAADVGMPRAIEDLGKPRALARELVEAEPRRRPSWSFGVLGAGAVLLIAMLAGMGYLFGLTDGVLGAGGGTVEGNFLGVHIVAVATDAELSWSLSGWSWPVTIAALIGFLVASAAWRALPIRR